MVIPEQAQRQFATCMVGNDVDVSTTYLSLQPEVEAIHLVEEALSTHQPIKPTTTSRKPYAHAHCHTSNRPFARWLHMDRPMQAPGSNRTTNNAHHHNHHLRLQPLQLTNPRRHTPCTDRTANVTNAVKNSSHRNHDDDDDDGKLAPDRHALLPLLLPRPVLSTCASSAYVDPSAPNHNQRLQAQAPTSQPYTAHSATPPLAHSLNHSP